jgi:sulfite exporter TauE/SafE
METVFLHCSEWFAAPSAPMLATALLAGLLGSFSHCGVMCAPLVATQMLALQQNRQPQRIMAYYHGGRIVTYIGLGMAAMMVSAWVFSGTLTHYVDILLVIAGISFIASAWKPHRTHHCATGTRNISGLLNGIQQPKLTYFTRGILMGFMPCGMTLAMLILVATASNMGTAALAMLIFGLATTPILQLVGLGGLRLYKHYPTPTRHAGRALMAGNGMILCLIGLHHMHVY